MQRSTEHQSPDRENFNGAQANTAAALVRGGLLATLCFLTWSASAAAEDLASGEAVPTTVRAAVFNVWELSTPKVDRVDDDGRGLEPQLRSAAEVLQRVRPDILLLNEIDYAGEGRVVARDFLERYLRVPQSGQAPLDYPYVFDAPVNTGVPSGLDLDNDGRIEGPDDAWGFGQYPGQYGMALLSRFPIEVGDLRSFRGLRWITMPGHLMPDGRGGRPAWYSPEETALLRLSSKSFWDVPIRLGEKRLHILASHPTPPVFDGDEDRNGRRNFDEIRLVADYLHGGDRASWIVDDQGRRGGFDPDASCLVMGDLNADPARGPADYGQRAIQQLLTHPRLKDPQPRSDGDFGTREGRRPYPGDSRSRTASFGRIDYVLPSRDLDVTAAGVYLPEEGDPLRRLVIGDDRASDHLLVWLDLSLETTK